MAERRKVQNGAPTNNLVRSAYVEGNAKVFPLILDLYLAQGSVVADVTYGKGAFLAQCDPWEVRTSGNRYS